VAVGGSGDGGSGVAAGVVHPTTKHRMHAVTPMIDNTL
jgi:hypothetical protein